ncbi:MAG: SRPBCC family protein [Acidimicrobiales bacterium]
MPVVDVTTEIAAPPDRVWQLIGDPLAMNGLTAECVEMQWVRGSTGPAVGARFHGRNRSAWRRWTTTCTIVRYEPARAIAWDVAFGPFAVARWSYLLEPGGEAGTTSVRERFEDRRGAALRATGPLIRGTRDTEGLNRRNMEATLARIKVRAES